MLVAEHRYCPATSAEHVYHLLEQLVPRIQLLTSVIDRVVSVFADKKYGIHRKLSGTKGKRFGDRRYDPESMLRR
jgi:hypothetical protein